MTSLPEEVVAWLVIFLLVLVCFLSHYFIKKYLVASVVAGVIGGIVQEVGSFLEAGFRTEWSNIALTLSVIYTFVIALVVGIPFLIIRRKSEGERGEEKGTG